MLRRITFLLLLLGAQARAQSTPFVVTIVELDDALGARMARAYAPQRPERLYCVTEWRTTELPDHTRIHITAMREQDVASTPAGMDVNGTECLDDKGAPLPTFHTHYVGSCQASPRDIANYVRRRALFDGVQCGDRFTVWYFSAQLSAAITALATK